MGNVGTLTRRELSVFFYSPIAYVVIALFLIVTGIFFSLFNFQPGQEASLRETCRFLPYILVFIIPMLTMRLLSEEFHSGTIEPLMTAPVSDTQVVLGKFLGTFVFCLILLATTVLHAVVIAAYGPLDVGLLLCTYLGLILLSALYVAVGLFFSACTRNQVIAVLCSFILLAIFTFLAELGATRYEGYIRLLLQHLSIPAHVADFTRGLLDTTHLVFFITTTAFFLFLTVKVLESRRWR